MKIIGQTGGGFILEATKSEVAYLMGVGGESDVPVGMHYGPSDGKYIGIEFQIKECWNRIRKLYLERDSLSRVCGQLRAMADLLEPISTVVDTLDTPKAE